MPVLDRFARARAALAAFAIAACAACQGVPPADAVVPVPPRAPVPDGDNSVHYSARLRGLMQRMNAMIYERKLTELEVDKQRLENAREIAAAARTLAGEVAAIGPPDPRDAADREDFTRLTQDLASAASELESLAAARRFSELAPQLDRVAHVCAACHLRFRVGAQ